MFGLLTPGTYGADPSRFGLYSIPFSSGAGIERLGRRHDADENATPLLVKIHDGRIE